MSENDHSNILIEELYSIDETLREHEAALRALIPILIAERPHVVIDPVFVSMLRARLTVSTTETQPIPSPFDDRLYSWISRIMPITAIAIFMLILMPPQQTTRPPHESGTYIAPLRESAPAAETYQKQAVPTMTPEADLGAENSMLMTESNMVNSFGVPDALNYLQVSVDTITLTAPSFLTILEDRGGEAGTVIGISPRLPVGYTNRTVITLQQPMRTGAIYHIALYADSGDGVFTPELDTAVIDPDLGREITVPFIANF